uniref:Uncharacterized protein n=1 Tax=Lepeophtheirus salmonis TaxID=72036 RepID=A0A0K2VF86_LEPSM
MLLRAPLRNHYISYLWPHIAQKHGIKLDGSKLPLLTSEAFSKAKRTSDRLALAYAAVQEEKQVSFVPKAIQDILKKDNFSNSGDYLVLGLLMHTQKDGAYTLSSTEASMFQFQLYTILLNNIYSPAELCLILPIFKRSDIKLEYQGLRKELYDRLHQLVKQSSFDSITLSCIVNLAVILNKDPILILKDDSKHILSILNETNYSKMSIQASIKVMSLGVTRGLTITKGSNINLKRLENGEMKHLSLREVVGVLYYYKRTNLSKDSAIIKYAQELLPIKSVDSIQDAIDIIQCYSYMADMGVVDDLFYEKLVQVVNGLPLIPQLDKALVCQKVMSVLSPSSTLSEVGSSDKCINLLTYTLLSYRFLKTNLLPSPDQNKLAHLCRLVRRHLPKNEIELKVYQEFLKNYLNSDQISFAYILPHMSSPNLVFGHLSGNSLYIPSYLLENSGHVKPVPEIGEWFVIMGTNSSKSIDEGQISNVDELLFGKRLIKKNQLTALGYKIIVVSSNDLIIHQDRISETILRWSFET